MRTAVATALHGFRMWLYYVCVCVCVTLFQSGPAHRCGFVQPHQSSPPPSPRNVWERVECGELARAWVAWACGEIYCQFGGLLPFFFFWREGDFGEVYFLEGRLGSRGAAGYWCVVVCTVFGSAEEGRVNYAIMSIIVYGNLEKKTVRI